MNPANVTEKISAYAGPFGLSKEEVILLLKDCYPTSHHVTASDLGYWSNCDEKVVQYLFCSVLFFPSDSNRRIELMGRGDTWEEAVDGLVRDQKAKHLEAIEEMKLYEGDVA